MTIAPMDAARMVRAFTGCHEGTSISGSASTLQRTAAPFDSHRKPYDTERMPRHHGTRISMATALVSERHAGVWIVRTDVAGYAGFFQGSRRSNAFWS